MRRVGHFLLATAALAFGYVVCARLLWPVLKQATEVAR